MCWVFLISSFLGDTKSPINLILITLLCLTDFSAMFQLLGVDSVGSFPFIQLFLKIDSTGKK